MQVIEQVGGVVEGDVGKGGGRVAVDLSAGVQAQESEQPLLGRADATAQARTIEALYRSAATGVAVSL